MLTSSTRKAILDNPKGRPRFFRKILMALEKEGGVGGEDRYLAERIIYLEVWSVWTPFVILLWETLRQDTL